MAASEPDLKSISSFLVEIVVTHTSMGQSVQPTAHLVSLLCVTKTPPGLTHACPGCYFWAASGAFFPPCLKQLAWVSPSHRIVEYSVLEGAHKDCWLQLLAPHRSTQKALPEKLLMLPHTDFGGWCPWLFVWQCSDPFGGIWTVSSSPGLWLAPCHTPTCSSLDAMCLGRSVVKSFLWLILLIILNCPLKSTLQAGMSSSHAAGASHLSTRKASSSMAPCGAGPGSPAPGVAGRQVGVGEHLGKGWVCWFCQVLCSFSLGCSGSSVFSKSSFLWVFCFFSLKKKERLGLSVRSTRNVMKSK